MKSERLDDEVMRSERVYVEIESWQLFGRIGWDIRAFIEV